MASSTFRGTISNDILTNPIKNTSYDIIVGLNGHDTINGANTAETIYGGNGLGTNGQLDNAANVDNDIIHGNGGNDTIYGQNGNDQLFGDAGVDKLYGGAGDDKLSGGDGLDVLDGGDGNDTLDGGSGVDVMSGGAGNDSYNVDNLLDQVIELTNGGTDTVFSTANTYSLTALASLVQAAQIENLTLNGATAFNGIGNALNNVLTGNDNANSLSGLDGNDTLAGGGGRDTLDGGAGNDKLDGGSGDDKLTGGAGNDELNGGSGIDAMSGGAGDDRYFVDATGDSVTELANQGTDTVNSAINYVLGNELENLVLAGSATKGTGNALNNTITGNAGDNELDGKQGNDTLVGGGGNDIYRIDSLGDVIIEGANEGAHDVAYVDVSGYTGSLANIDQVMYAGGTPEQAFTIEGRAGDDTIIVPTGTNLVINAGAGRDFISIADVVQKATLLMGSGADTLYLAQTTPPATPPADRVFPHYRVTDFSSADGDKIELGLQHLGQSLGYSGAEAKPYSVWQTAPAAGGDGVTINIETSGDTTADNFIDLSGVTAPLDQNHLLGVIYPAANSAPHTSDYQIRAAEDDVLSGALALTQMDPNAGDTVKVTSINGTAISAPGDQRAFIRLEHGNLYISPKNGDFVYLPDPNFHGTDVFRYGVADNHGAPAATAGLVSLLIEAVNDVPVAASGSASGFEDSPLFYPVHLENLDADFIDGQPLRTSHINGTPITASGQKVAVDHGEVEVVGVGNGLVFTPEENFNGTTSFTYNVTDGENASSLDDGLITLTLAAVADAPQAQALNFAVLGSDVLQGSLNLAAMDPDAGDSARLLQITENVGTVANPNLVTHTFSRAEQGAVSTELAHGQLIINPGSGAFSFTPDVSFAGNIDLSYLVGDNGNLQDSSTISIEVENAVLMRAVGIDGTPFLSFIDMPSTSRGVIDAGDRISFQAVLAMTDIPYPNYTAPPVPLGANAFSATIVGPIDSNGFYHAKAMDPGPGSGADIAIKISPSLNGMDLIYTSRRDSLEWTANRTISQVFLSDEGFANPFYPDSTFYLDDPGYYGDNPYFSVI